MIATLDANADSEAVRRALVGRGLWVKHFEAGMRAPLSRAAIAVGAAGLITETHDDPGRALGDGPQALLVEEIEEVYRCSAETSHT